MKFRRLTPMLWTENLKESITFYTEILGFTCGEFNENWQWAALRRNEVELMLVKPNEHTAFDTIGFTGSLYFEIDDVNHFWNLVRGKTEVVYEPETFDWGMKEFAIKDNNGYILQFGQSIKNE